jgi:hypothetical protein
LKELAEHFGVQKEYRELQKLAQLGKLYEKQLRDEVVRLCLVLELGAEEPVLRSIVDKAAAEDLMKLKEALQKRYTESMPMESQLSGSFDGEIETDFLI